MKAKLFGIDTEVEFPGWPDELRPGVYRVRIKGVGFDSGGQLEEEWTETDMEILAIEPEVMS